MKTLYNSKRFLATVLGNYGRILSLIVVAMMACSAMQAGTYYIDLRQLGAADINVYWIQNGSSTDIKSKITINTPEPSMIQLNDFEFSTSDAGKIKWSMAWSNGGQSEIQVPISSTHIGSHNCIKIIKTGSCNDPAKLSEYLEFTDYGTPGPTPGGDVLPVNTGSGKTRQEGDQLFVYIDGYPNTPYLQNKSLYSYKNISGSPAITTFQDAAGTYLYFILGGTSTSGERVYKITCSANNACAKLTFANGATVPSVSACSDAPTAHAPSVRIGKQPTTDGTTATINLQMADWGCAAVDKVKVYYTTNGSVPTTSSSSFEIEGLNIESNTNFNVEKSDLASGTYRIKVAAHNSVDYGDLSDEASFTVEKICTQPQAANFHVSGLTGKTYTGTNQSPAINPDEGMGTMTVKYDGVAGTGKTDAGTYAITVSVAEGNIFCASTEDISLGDFVIGKANREISISNTEQSLATCENNTITLTSTTTAPEDGTITYSTVSGGTGAGSIDGDKLSCTTAGTVKVQVSITGGTNYNDATSNQATATFYALPTAGSITASPASPICKGTSTTLAVAGFTEGSTLQWYKGSSILTGQTSASYITEALSEAATYKVIVTKNNCISETSDFTVEVKSTSLEITATPAVVNPYTPVTLIAKNQSGTPTNSTWTITGAGSYFTESENPTGVSTVVMKPAKDVETTVTATATVDGCSVSDTYSVTPTTDTETCN